MFLTVLALTLSRMHRFYLPLWPSISSGVQPSNPPWPRPALLLKCCDSRSAGCCVTMATSCPNSWQLRQLALLRHANRSAVRKRNFEPKEWWTGPTFVLNDSIMCPGWFTSLTVSRTRCVDEVSCRDRTHLLPNVRWKAFLKLLMDPCLKTCGVRRQFVSKSLGFQWQTKDSRVWLNLTKREEKGSDGLERVPFHSYEIRWDKKTLKVCDYRCQQAAPSGLWDFNLNLFGRHNASVIVGIFLIRQNIVTQKCYVFSFW